MRSRPRKCAIIFCCIVGAVSVIVFCTTLEPIKEKAQVSQKPPDSINLAPAMSLRFQEVKVESWSTEAHMILYKELKVETSQNNTSLIPAYRGDCNSTAGTRARQSGLPKKFQTVFVEDELEANAQNDRMPNADKTLPCIFQLKKSKIIGAGMGVFTKIPLPKGLIFGNYKGAFSSDTDDMAVKKAGYAWLLGANDAGMFFVDASDAKKSNWLRYVNSARFEEEQNLYPIHVDLQMYYYLYKNVEANTELLVWYGKEYAAELGIWIVNANENKAMAPKRAHMACPTCRGLPAVDEIGKKNVATSAED